MLIMAIITMVGCELPENATFPSEFSGAWKRAYQSVYTNTLTFTSDTLRDSTQSYYWELRSVSGNSYTLKSSDSDFLTSITIKYENGNLVFGRDNTSGEHDWQGTWEKQ